MHSLIDKKEQYNSIEEYLLFLKMLKAYQFANNFATGSIVLDVGCGAGYGAFLLSKSARKVLAVDLDPFAIEYAVARYSSPNLVFKLVEMEGLKETNFDLITCFQVIEHINISQVEGFLRKIQRSLGREGVAIISTPNKLIRLLPFLRPWNRDHFLEYSPDALYRLTKKYFSKVELVGITAKKEILEIEKRRVKRNAFLGLLRSLLPPKSYEMLRGFYKGAKKLSRANYEPFPAQKEIECYTIADYEITFSPEHKKWLDILTVCSSPIN